MLKALIGQKLNMSLVFDSHGRAIPVTGVLVEPNIIVSLKEKDNDGYKAAQIGYGKSKKPTKAFSGHLKKNGVKSIPALLKEVDFEGDVKPGQEIKVDEVFRKGSVIDVIGRSKGKGFAGVVKRWGFHGGPKTHGQSDRHRAPGSIGSGTTPGRVQKGLKMAGHMGNDQVTVFGLEVMELDKETGKILLKGSIPGPTGSLILLKKSKKKREVYHEPEIPTQPAISGEEEKVEVEENDAKVEEFKTEKKPVQNNAEQS